jgi:hypothetical protein
MHAAILAADFGKLEQLSPALEEALDALKPQRDRAFLELLQRKADRNAACAKAAGRGVRAAIRRLEEVRKNQTGLVTYDENGKRADHGSLSELSRRL